MKFILTALVSFTFILVFSGCQKVIDIDLNDTDQKVVVEGTILRGDTIQRVRVTKTQNFDESTSPPAVDDATVSVVDNLGNAASFTSVGNGWYELTSYPGVEGRTYTLTVSVDGETYSGSSTMPNYMPLDSLFVEYYPFGADTLISLVPSHYDEAGVTNFYQFHIYRNGEKDKGIYIQDDQFTDGNLILQPLFVSDLEVNDIVRVDLFCIDKPVYSYFNQLSVNSSSSATPANPISNMTGGCLGYFSARTFHSRTIVVN
ncbi:DUF4249 domain-containing protein [Fluviicola taffensis]|uniref:DUF4249 domain-containing protein n=1 Tax=Fluviicola taffensis (strain DSM 16823 / NCIMB 13979 / RW262) TaxID=755732 RepID=F2I9D2_FLUTR|nr:DUF4249 domain-containing protein [Fluviicola taffensis]AEA44089.1 hypothetical protein Fluta_2103 [Fluviicola taffensis DSM 16823]